MIYGCDFDTDEHLHSRVTYSQNNYVRFYMKIKKLSLFLNIHIFSVIALDESYYCCSSFLDENHWKVVTMALEKPSKTFVRLWRLFYATVHDVNGHCVFWLVQYLQKAILLKPKCLGHRNNNLHWMKRNASVRI